MLQTCAVLFSVDCMEELHIVVVSDMLNMMDSGVLILFANSCRTRGWRPSGPGDLNVFSFFNYDASVNGLIEQSLIVLEHLIGSSGVSPSGSLVNTEEK